MLTVQELAKKFQQSNDTLFVSVERQEEYLELLRQLDSFDKIRLSTFFANDTDMPNLNELELSISGADKPTIVLGVLSYYVFRYGIDWVSRYIKQTCLNKHKGLLFVGHGLKNQFSKTKDPRIVGKVVCIGNTQSHTPPSIILAKKIGKGVVPSLKAFFVQLEEQGLHSATVCTTATVQSFANYWTVSNQPTAWQRLTSASMIANVPEHFGTSIQWEWLISQETKLLSSTQVDINLKDWQKCDDNTKWHTVLSAKKTQSLYLQLVAQKSQSIDQFQNYIYQSLLDIDRQDGNFDALYQERKNITKNLDNPQALNVYCNLSLAKGNDRIYYLTDCTQRERDLIVDCIVQSKPQFDILLDILKKIYPLMAQYLQNYNYGSDYLNNYFNNQSYKYCKLTNHIQADFGAMVERCSVQREFGQFDQSVQHIKKLVQQPNTAKFWIDALGAEYCAFISARAAEYGLVADISFGIVCLPTTTEFNREVFVANEFTKIDELDDIKHARAKDIDYQKTTNPTYIHNELLAIDKAIKKIQQKIDQGSCDKAIIASDHGASRLALIAKQNKLDCVQGASLRFVQDGNFDTKALPQIVKSGDYNCIANYDYFKGGQAQGVEVHGGASIEELVVPIIVLSKQGKQAYSFVSQSNRLTIDQGIVEIYVIVLSHFCQQVYTKVGQHMIQPNVIVDNVVQFDLSSAIKKTGTYEIEVYVQNKFIGSDNIKVDSKLGEEQELF